MFGFRERKQKREQEWKALHDAELKDGNRYILIVKSVDDQTFELVVDDEYWIEGWRRVDIHQRMKNILKEQVVVIQDAGRDRAIRVKEVELFSSKKFSWSGPAKGAGDCDNTCDDWYGWY